ncbi:MULTISPECIES: inositol monophosphatase family protein [unclassified Acidiphilium]|jgi:myo-inositol-1(or 4)-monophosphatase|uniref:inositol monophosphatase family protein n=1 Tax=unclassified Acidiphilium TaxID=2617493 RepID=UPI000BD1AC08|nr:MULTISPECIES: inositol monophosphatase family protein [unclassified Acidiphilium]OYV55958.1 MAG: histidinol phosphate phosphatase [Acidiphilium sp. 20-67-58]HQT61564.1 inositol monophosphatase family protein [Acidiphilium sp.]
MRFDPVAVASAAADAAGDVIRAHFRARIDVDTKADASPVTLADRGAEAAIRRVLDQYCPDHAVIGEEMGGKEGGRFTWVIDPIDGTRAFITGRPVFATLIALLEHGRPILGLIDQPVLGERWLAHEGELRFSGPHGGAPGTRIVASLAEAELSCTSPDMFTEPQFGRFRRLAGACRRVTYGGDAYGYGLLALGQIDVIAEADLKPWDWSALAPVIEAAGGAMTDWRGAPLTLESDGTALALGNPALLGDAVALLGG